MQGCCYNSSELARPK